MSNYHTYWAERTSISKEHTSARPVMVGNLNAGVGSDPPFAFLALNLRNGALLPHCPIAALSWPLPRPCLFDFAVSHPQKNRSGRNDIPSRDGFHFNHFVSLGRGEIVSERFCRCDEEVTGKIICIVISHALQIYILVTVAKTWRSVELGCMLGWCRYVHLFLLHVRRAGTISWYRLRVNSYSACNIT